MSLKAIFYMFLSTVYAKDQNILTTEVFAIPLDPPMFNWTYEGIKDQFVYEASLQGLPDLPSWINYVFSDQHHSGFLYGVPPKSRGGNCLLKIVALNKRSYETRVETMNVIISEKRNQARFQVHLKIDNLNVVDLFDVDKMEALKDIFRKQLWKESESDLYLTFLGSAVELGARKPLNPNKGEGVVVRLGSEFMFSTELIELQEEVKPLWRVPECPRDFKRTSVERIFRDAGFALDWCSFRLIDNNNSAMHHTEVSKDLPYSEDDEIYDMNDRWSSISSTDVPKRNYVKELLVSILVPVVILVVMGLILSFLLCFHHDEIEDEESEVYFSNLFHICTDYYYDHYIYTRVKQINYVAAGNVNNFPNMQNATESLRNFSTARDQSMSPDLRSHTNSPNSTTGRGVHCRPSPPPYVRPKYRHEL